MHPDQRFHDATQQLAAGNYAAAEAGFRQLMAQFPTHLPTLNNLAACFFSQGKIAAALDIFRRLIELAPDNALSHYNAGRCLRDLGRAAEAAAAYEQALARKPHYAEARENLANVLVDLGRFAAALAHYQEGMRTRPARPDNYRQAALILKDQGDIDGAQACVDRGIKKITRSGQSGADALRILRALLLPPIAADAQQIHRLRQNLQSSLDALLNMPLKINDPVSEIGIVPFFLAYHGENDRVLNETIARLYRQACPRLCFTAPHVSARAHRTRPRIGVVSAYAGEHTVARFFTPSLQALAERAEVRLYYPGRDARALAASSPSGLPAVALPDALFECQQALAGEQLDLLIYPEVGIHPLPYFLAHARLAPVQIALYGQPVTTGNPSIDYFLSHAGSEPADALAHYSEKLLLLPAAVAPARIRPRKITPSNKRRADFGLTEDIPLYLCAQSLFKIHPDFDAVLASILRRDVNGEVLLVAARDHWATLIEQRLAKHAADIAGRIRLLPYQSLPDFFALAQCCDVALDTHQYSGGGTSFDSLQNFLPIVTLPGPTMRARQTAALYAHMGIDGLTARSLDDYIDKAVCIANDVPLRQQLRAQIQAGQARLFDDVGSSDAFCELILGTLPAA